jgi:hypothetical protein
MDKEVQSVYHSLAFLVNVQKKILLMLLTFFIENHDNVARNYNTSQLVGHKEFCSALWKKKKEA